MIVREYEAEEYLVAEVDCLRGSQVPCFTFHGQMVSSEASGAIRPS